MNFPSCAGATPSFLQPWHFTGWFPTKAGVCLPFLGQLLPHFLRSPPWVIQSSPQLSSSLSLCSSPEPVPAPLPEMLWPGQGSARDGGFPLPPPAQVKPLGLLA